MNLRAIAARVIAKVMAGESLSDCLPQALLQIPEPRDQALVQAICYGVCRRYFYLDALLFLLLEKPFKEKDQDVCALLLVGLYQLIDMRIPAYAAVAETVNATIELKKDWSKGLVNAVLREYQRRTDELNNELKDDLEASTAHPEWLIRMLQKAWPAQWESILAANNEHPPLSLRVNQQRLSRESYLAKLSAVNIEAHIIPETQNGMTLANPVDVTELPDFMEGDASVQDGAAQLAAELLLLEPNLSVLDACAAPGGKTAHILESQKDLERVVAIDIDAKRLKSVTENLQRLNLSATCVTGDAAKTDKWWDGKLFDRILLDAPCSASGVIRRHPDIKLLRSPDDIAHLCQEQLKLLKSLWPLLKPGGLLVYATCSVFPRENTGVLTQFIQEHEDAVEEKIDADWGVPCEVGRQVLPGMHGMDGFYYGRLRKFE
ncbi:MAG: 16S rRNA (cytosine(967)-C(5))-methyltransferase RsmB [Gammaproteobacteria bacterium]|nr:16S rRNA (cytosine(967)-C(5))-methyltransferase RsmB [Gammaproteobacteria bacterium]